MKITVIGSGRVSLVSGECFADLGYADTPKDALQDADAPMIGTVSILPRISRHRAATAH